MSPKGFPPFKALQWLRTYLFSHFPYQSAVLNYDAAWELMLSGELKLNEGPLEKSPHTLRLLESIVEEGSSVLDIGCGNGEVLSFLKERRLVVGYGVDISERALEAAASKGLKVMKADITQKGVTIQETYDYVILSEVLEHLPNAEEVMLKLRGKFKKYVLIVIPNTGFFADRLRLLFGKFPKQWFYHPAAHLRFWTVSDFLFWVQQLGYKVEKYHGLRYEEYDRYLPPLWKWYPRLFARGVLYQIVEKKAREN